MPTAQAAAWQNWSGSVQSKPTRLADPTDEQELRDILLADRNGVRVRGTGHSFTPVCATGGTLISLQTMPGDVLATRETADGPRATLNAGKSLNELSRALQAQGLAFRNLGDIDVQTLAGATMTATHGSGKGLRSLSGELTAARLMTADGNILPIDSEEDPRLMDAARVSLGALGILLQAEIALRPAYRLKRTAAARRTADVLSEAVALWDRHRHFEFFALPFCDYALTLVQEETDEPDRHENAGDDDKTMEQLRLLRSLTRRLPGLRRAIMNRIARTIRPEIKTGHSWSVLASSRNVRFNEMEYHLPVDQGLSALEEVLHLIEREQREVFFPIECRMTEGDTGWLSPFQGGPRISVAIHAHYRDDWRWFIERAEPIFRRRGGRPHWGKIHGLGAEDLRALYPDFDAFCQLRAELDPKGRFLNDHLRKLFGVTPG